MESNRPVNVETINQNILKLSGGVRGPIYIAAQKMKAEGENVVLMNVGNPHGLGQAPLSWVRSVMALVFAPHLLNHPSIHDMFAPDVIETAKFYLEGVTGGVGAYSDSKGSLFIRYLIQCYYFDSCFGFREIISDFFVKRDGLPANPDHIFMTNGASEAVQMIIKAIIRDESDAVLAPIPQYPLYSGTIALNGGTLVGYYLKEETVWGLQQQELERALEEGRGNGINVRALVIINPGNPTGACLRRDDIEDIIRFCVTNQLLLMADEVYQTNVYDPNSEFVSCRSVLNQMGEPFVSSLQMASFHTVSKGVHGECGLRFLSFFQFLNFF